jgi:aminobenzoyl-glutamate utilization protein B
LAAGEVQPRHGTDYGSTDVGDISMVVPTVGLNTATWVPGTPRSWQSRQQAVLSFKGMQVASKTPPLRSVARIRISNAARTDFQHR